MIIGTCSCIYTNRSINLTVLPLREKSCLLSKRASRRMSLMSCKRITINSRS
jgi:hypothetical protein